MRFYRERGVGGLTPAPEVHIVRRMNNSTNEPITSATRRGTDLPDALIDELEDSMTRLARLMSSRHVGPDCCPDTLNLSQMMLMRALESAGELKMADVATLLAIKPPAASAMVDGLERSGYVARAISPDDRRVTLVCLTEEGTEALLVGEATRRSHMRKYLALITEDDVHALIRIHHKLIDAIDSGLV